MESSGASSRQTVPESRSNLAGIALGLHPNRTRIAPEFAPELAPEFAPESTLPGSRIARSQHSTPQRRQQPFTAFPMREG
ncbi:hypothetical protein [Paraburkholderia sp. J41]|uniref:hypothetical protein n=1 Tax=Paraburkholderia sp. J41 TaxID=2805433 RepID=UPI002AC36E49|nr:hypothetical protein [Paraburkholderia sp. J41]